MCKERPIVNVVGKCEIKEITPWTLSIHFPESMGPCWIIEHVRVADAIDLYRKGQPVQWTSQSFTVSRFVPFDEDHIEVVQVWSHWPRYMMSNDFFRKMLSELEKYVDLTAFDGRSFDADGNITWERVTGRKEWEKVSIFKE